MIKFVFLDLDDTILDFHKAERVAIVKTLAAFGAEPTEAVLQRYHEINILHWQMLERGELTREQVQTGRFAALFRELGLQVDAHACAMEYMRNLSVGHYFLPGALETVQQLQGKYRLFLASNGTASVQHSRLASAQLKPYFEDVFISEEIGHNKPAPEFFHGCFERIPDFDPKQAIMVGDGLTSDMLGANNAGLLACWVNLAHNPRKAEIRIDYEIESIVQLPALLENIK
jgi:2-haloacid dehalogenase